MQTLNWSRAGGMLVGAICQWSMTSISSAHGTVGPSPRLASRLLKDAPPGLRPPCDSPLAASSRRRWSSDQMWSFAHSHAFFGTCSRAGAPTRLSVSPAKLRRLSAGCSTVDILSLTSSYDSSRVWRAFARSHTER